MTARVLLAACLTTALTGCAARLWLGPIVIDEYASVQVRIYRAGLQCRVEIIAATETIQTQATRCSSMSHRPRTD